MSYKIDLSGLSREGEVSLTQQLVERFRQAIDDGELEPGEKLPPTRELATEVGVNHLTAARVYRKLAELGCMRPPPSAAAPSCARWLPRRARSSATTGRSTRCPSTP